MGLTKASTVKGEQREGALDLDLLGKEGAAVLITVYGFAETKDYGQGECTPVQARIVALTGSCSGQVDDDALVFKAGIRHKLQTIGEHYVGRLRPYGARKAIGLEDEDDGDYELAEKALAELDGGDVRESATPLGDSVKEAKANAKAAGKAARKIALDDEPPF